jgi:hypothetical protein
MAEAKPFSALFARWKEADGLARAAEEHLLNATMRALDSIGTLPSVEEWQEAKRLRARADVLLDEAIEQMRGHDQPRARRKPPGNAANNRPSA